MSAVKPRPVRPYPAARQCPSRRGLGERTAHPSGTDRDRALRGGRLQEQTTMSSYRPVQLGPVIDACASCSLTSRLARRSVRERPCIACAHGAQVHRSVSPMARPAARFGAAARSLVLDLTSGPLREQFSKFFIGAAIFACVISTFIPIAACCALQSCLPIS